MEVLRVVSCPGLVAVQLRKTRDAPTRIQEALKLLGVTRDYRKHILSSARHGGTYPVDGYDPVSDKSGRIHVAVFSGKEVVVVEVVFPDECRDRVARALRDGLGLH
jgi:hypothetical protein